MNNLNAESPAKPGFVYFLLLILSGVFFVFKLNTLSLPYFWDEAWVYAPALKKMSLHPGLLPSSLEDSFSRGHPLLYHFTGGIWIKIFGKSELSLHSFAMTISFSFLFSLFYIGKKLVNPLFGIVLFSSMIVQDVFFGQSALVLPEVFLAMAMFWSYYFFLREKWWIYALVASLLVLIKEQGILFVGVIWFWSLAQKIFNDGYKAVFKREFVIQQTKMTIPLVVLLTFLVIQKIQRGYFFFPTHIDMIKLEWNNFVFLLRLSSDILFAQTGRFAIFLLFILSFLFLSKRVVLWKRISVALLIFIAYKCSTGKWETPFIFNLILLSFLFFFYIYQQHLKPGRSEKDLRGPIPLLIIVFVGFASINFFCNRYLLCLFPFVLFYFFYELFSNLKSETTMTAIFSAAVILFCGYSTYKKKSIGDESAYYPNAIHVQQDLVKYCEDHKLGPQKILVPYVMLSNIVNSEIGFRKTDEVYTNISNRVDPTEIPQFIVFTEFERNPEMDSLLATGKYYSLQKFSHGNAYGEMFALKK